MVSAGTTRTPSVPRYGGLRLSAEGFLDLPDDGHKYELINGVVVVVPPPSFEHSDIVSEVIGQLILFVRPRRLGKLLLGPGIRFSADHVYQPNIAYYEGTRTKGTQGHLTIAPDLVMEILSPQTRAKDLSTKHDDYERFGVREYWAIGAAEAWKFLLRDGKYAAEEIKGDSIPSEVIAGFTLDLKTARAAVSNDDDGGDGADGL